MFKVLLQYLTITAILGLTIDLNAQISVTVTGASNTTPALMATYPNLAAALTDFNAVTSMTGPVVFNVSGTETAPASGFAIGNTTVNPQLSATNSLTIVGNATLNAGVGVSTPMSPQPDGVLKLDGCDWVTIDGLTIVDANATNPATVEFGIGLFKLSATDGASNNTIQNCTINLGNINNEASTAPMVEGAVGILIINSTSIAATTALTPTSPTGSNSNNKVYNNDINGGNFGIMIAGFAAATPFDLGDTSNDIGGSSAATGNTILNFGGGNVSSSGIRVTNQWNVNISYNTVNNNNGLVSGHVNHPSTLRGIYAQSGTSAEASIIGNVITVKGGGTSSQVTGIENGIGATPNGNTVSINSNTVTGEYLTATTGVFYGIYANTTTASTLNIQGNTVSNMTYSNNTLTGTGAVTGIFASGSNAASTFNISQNTVSGIQRFGSTGGTTIGINISAGTASMITDVQENSISNLSIDGAGTASTMYGIQVFGANNTISSNTISNLNILKSTATSVFYGIFHAGSSAGQVTIANNQVLNLNNAGTGTTYGIYGGTTTANVNRDFIGNTIDNLVCNCTTITGINAYGTIVNVANNKIANLTTNTTSGPVVSGIQQNTLATSGQSRINNNLITGLFSPSATTTTPATAPSIRGINVTTTATTSNIEVAYNSILINASSTGTNFGTTAMFCTGSATFTSGRTKLLNNIFVNTSTSNGTGKTVSLHRSSTNILNYDSLSNNNLFYSGTPSASNVIFYDGTNADQNLLDFKNRVTPRESNSVTENPPFLSTSIANPQFLHIDPMVPTLIESGGITVAGITADIDGETRNGTSPDIGGDEFNGTTASNMSYASSTTTQLNVTNALSNLVEQVVIGVEVVMSGSLNPISLSDFTFNTNGTTNIADIANAKVYYTGVSSVFAKTNSFGTPVAMPSGSFMVTGSQILSGGTNYFWLTFDVPCNAVLGNFIDAECNAITLSSGSVTPTIQAPAGNRMIEIGPISGTKTVGTGGDFSTLNEAINKVNLTGLNGDLTLEILNDLTVSTTTVINQWNDCGGVYDLTIKPATGVSAIITGAISANAIIKLNGADRVTIDGSNNNTNSRNLTINNTTANANSSTIWMGSLTGNGCENNIIKNCKLNGASTNHSCIVISSGTTLGGVAETANNNNSILNNEMGLSLYGIAVFGASGNDQNNIISENIIGSTIAANKIRRHSIALFQQANCQVNDNLIFGVTSTASTATTYPAGIYFGGTASTIDIFNNVIKDVKNTSTTGYNASGININVTTTSSDINIYNNVISDIAAYGNAANTRNGYGIFMQGGGGVDIVNNSIQLTSNPTLTTGLPACINIAPTITALNTVNIVNNNLINSQSVGAERYAIYSGAGDTVFALVDYNNYFSNGPNLGFIGSNRTTLSDIQMGFGDNLNSLNISPDFIPSSELKLFGPSSLDNEGVVVSGLTTDFEGDSRSLTTPDIGADEWNFSNNTADFCNLESPGDTTYIINDPQINIYGQIFEPGQTEAPGANPSMFVWLGISTVNSNPNTWPTSSWMVASYDSQQGNNDRFVKAVGNGLSVDTYYYAYRYLALPGQFTYGGYSSTGGGVWDGTNNKNGVLIVKLCENIPLLSVQVSEECLNAGATSFDISTTTSPNVIVNWFNSPTGGTSLFEGNNFTTPILTQNDTFYAQTEILTNGSLGPLDPTIGTSSASNIAIGTQRMFFDVFNTVVLDSVDIFPTASVGSVGSVVIRNSSQVPLDTFFYTTTVTGGLKQTIPIGMVLQPGTAYEIGQGTAITLTRNTTGAVYPYATVDLSITGNSFDPVYYYFFYNWKYSFNCQSDVRIPVPVSFTTDMVKNGNNGGAESLRAVVGCANATDTIYFDAGVTMVNLTDSLLLNKNLTLQGNAGLPMLSFNLTNQNDGVVVPGSTNVILNNISVKNQNNAVPLILNSGNLDINDTILKGAASIPEVKNLGTGTIDFNGSSSIKIE